MVQQIFQLYVTDEVVLDDVLKANKDAIINGDIIFIKIK